MANTLVVLAGSRRSPLAMLPFSVLLYEVEKFYFRTEGNLEPIGAVKRLEETA
jgi:hypothetical protein